MTDDQWKAEVRRINDPVEMLAKILDSTHMLGDRYYSDMERVLMDQAQTIVERAAQQQRRAKPPYKDTPGMATESPDEHIIVVRSGDYCEVFGDGAIFVHRNLGYALQHFGDTPMVGIPAHALEDALKRMILAGARPIVCSMGPFDAASIEAAQAAAEAHWQAAYREAGE